MMEDMMTEIDPKKLSLLSMFLIALADTPPEAMCLMTALMCRYAQASEITLERAAEDVGKAIISYREERIPNERPN